MDTGERSKVLRGAPLHGEDSEVGVALDGLEEDV